MRVFKVICMQCVLPREDKVAILSWYYMYVYANRHVNLRERINCYESPPKHKNLIKDLDNIIAELWRAKRACGAP